MDFLKKAKSQMKNVAGEAQGMYTQYKQQHQPQQQNPAAPAYHAQNQHGSWSQPGYSQPAYQSNAQGGQYAYNPNYYQPPPMHQPPVQQSPMQQAPFHQPPMAQSPYPSPHQPGNYYHHAPSQAPPLPTPPADQAYNMKALDQALPPVASYSPFPSQAYTSPPPPTQHSQQVLPPSPPATSTYRGLESGCPRHDAALVERVQFHILKTSSLGPTDLTEAGTFAVCNACFTTHIARYDFLAGHFEPYQSSASEKDAQSPNSEILACSLALPAVRQMLYRECLPQHTISPLIRFVQLDLPPCTGAIQEDPADLFESRSVNDLGVCRTCFETHFRGTPFESDMKGPSAQSGWYCDLGNKGFIYNALLAELLDAQKPDIKRFAVKAKKRMSVAVCPGEGVPIAPAGSSGPHYVWEPENGDTGVFCEACFMDKVQGTPAEKFFNKRVALEKQYYGDIACNLADLPSTYAMQVAARAGDGEVWRRCVTGRGTLPPCAGIEGVDEESLQSSPDIAKQWRCVTKHPSIEVCPFCYTAVAELLGAGRFFSPITRPLQAGVFRMCFLSQAPDLSVNTDDHKNFENTLVWRGTILRNWIHHGFDMYGDFSGLERATERLGSLPPPCASNKRAILPASARKWYGNHFLAEGDENKVGISVCEECYTNCIKDTPLEWFAGVDITERIRTKNPTGFTCNTWTNRSRAELRASGESGNFLTFAAYWAARCDCERRRKEIDDRCQVQAERQKVMLAQINIQNQMAGINLMQQLNAQQNATIMGVGGSVAEAAATDYGQRYGNSAVGYGYLTAGGANAAQAHLNAQAFAGRSHKVSVADFRESGDTWQDTQNILALAKQIEQEWKEIQ